MDDFLHAAARARGGYLFRSDLLDLGFGDSHINQALRAGVLERLRHGTYAAVESEPLTPERRHVLIARSVTDKLGPGVAISHHSAALIHAGTLWGTDLRTVHLTRLDGRSGRTEAGVTYHVGRIVPDDDIVFIDGRPVVVADRAVIESNSLCSVEAGMVTTSFALRASACTRDELDERMRRCERWPGMLRVRLAVAKAEPGCESVGEVRSLFLFGAHRVPRPQIQFRVLSSDGREVARCDFGWEEFRHVGEFDGAVKYGKLNPHIRSDPRQVLVEEKVREDRIRNEQYGVSRWMWRDLDHRPEALARSILAGLENSRRLYGRPSAQCIG